MLFFSFLQPLWDWTYALLILQVTVQYQVLKNHTFLEIPACTRNKRELDFGNCVWNVQHTRY